MITVRNRPQCPAVANNSRTGHKNAYYCQYYRASITLNLHHDRTPSARGRRRCHRSATAAPPLRATSVPRVGPSVRQNSVGLRKRSETLILDRRLRGTSILNRHNEP